MRKRILVLAAVLALAAACTGGGGERGSPSASPTPEPWRGGTLRLALVGNAWWRLDPAREYMGTTWELFRCCLLRTLFSYNGLSVPEGGAEAKPDLAAGPPQVSADGLTWTIHIKPRIRYAPPLEDVEITAQDFVRALVRAASPSTKASYPFYYSVIEGFDAYASGDAETISGLETPDEHTLVLRLTEPAGDLPNRLALAAAAPIPPSPYRPDAVLGAAEGHDRTYGRFLMASGPYMIEGAQDLDLSLPPAEQGPIAGYAPARYDDTGAVVAPGSLTLVRNPSWDPETDALRAAYADRIEVQLKGEWPEPSPATRRELVPAVEAGDLDFVPDLAYMPAELRRYRADPGMEGRVTTLPTGSGSYIVMNLAVRPFDDLHIRRAVAFAIDASELRRKMLADPKNRSIASQTVVVTHLAPDAIEGDLLASYDPYPASLERAKQETALSRYDRNGDGRCDAPECSGVLGLTSDDAFDSAAAEEVAAWLAPIGIDLRIEVVPGVGMYERLHNEREKVPLGIGFSYASDLPNASGFFLPGFASSSVTDGYNDSLVGATPSQLRAWGYQVTRVPSVDDRIDRCMAMIGVDQTECWADLDRYLMEDVVPWVPYLASVRTYVVSKRVAAYSYSPSAFGLALDRIALVEGSD